MKRTALGHGVYVDEYGEYWARLWVHKRRTWRKLDATKEKQAIIEARGIIPSGEAQTFIDAALAYTEANCPNRRLEEREVSFCETEKTKLLYLKDFFGAFPCNEIRLPLCIAYKKWRIPKIKKGTGERTIDLELSTLSNVLNYQVALGQLDFNYIRSGRPRFRKDTDVRHCREVAPDSAETIQKIVVRLFEEKRSEVFGWLSLFHQMTGCRTSELLRLRIDARNENEPGFISGNHLFLGRRSKGGVNPWAIIFPEFQKMLTAFLWWHKERYPESHWFFPGQKDGQHVEKGGLAHALRRITKELLINHVTPHGFRSFYVTKRRSDGVSDAVIAGEIGDKDVSLISKTYGDRPANWTGGKKLTWLPSGQKPSWSGLKLD